MKNFLWRLLILFCIITTFQVFFIGLLPIVHGEAIYMESRDLWRILLVSLAGTLPTLIYIRSENFSRRRFILFSAIHLLLTAGAVFGLLIYFEWVHATNAIFTGIIFIVIYIACYIYFDHQEKKLAKALNEKINAFRKGENASDNDEY